MTTSFLRRGWVMALLACLLLAPVVAIAVDDPSEMLPDPAQEQRAEAIGAQLRLSLIHI